MSVSCVLTRSPSARRVGAVNTVLMSLGLIDEPLKNLSVEFAAAFVRIHRNSLVRVNAIEQLMPDEAGRYSVRLCGLDEDLPVSRRHLGELRNHLKQ